MAAPKKYIGDTITFSYRTEAERWRVFNALLSLKGDTPTGIFSKTVDEYINANKQLLGTTLEGLEGDNKEAAAKKAIRQGRHGPP